MIYKYQPELVTIAVYIPDEELDGEILDAYMTDEVDTWGKRTFHVVQANGDLKPLYLFKREYRILEKHNA